MGTIRLHIGSVWGNAIPSSTKDGIISEPEDSQNSILPDSTEAGCSMLCHGKSAVLGSPFDSLVVLVVVEWERKEIDVMGTRHEYIGLISNNPIYWFPINLALHFDSNLTEFLKAGEKEVRGYSC